MNFETGFFGFIHINTIAENTLCIQDLGLEKRQNERYYYDNKNRDYEGYLFQYTLDGYGLYRTMDRDYKLTKDKAFLLSFPDEGSYFLPDAEASGNHWTFLFIHFKGPAVKPFFNRIRELSGPVMNLDAQNPAILLVNELYHHLKSGKQLEQYEDSEWLFRFLTALLRSIEFPQDRNPPSLVDAAACWIQSHYALPQSLEDMSRELGVSLSHLSRQFHKQKGVTLIQYLTRTRLEHAMSLLVDTDIPIHKISEKCGFGSRNYFSKVYKKVLHMTPEEYRKQHSVTGSSAYTAWPHVPALPLQKDLGYRQ